MHTAAWVILIKCEKHRICPLVRSFSGLGFPLGTTLHHLLPTGCHSKHLLLPSLAIPIVVSWPALKTAEPHQPQDPCTCSPAVLGSSQGFCPLCPGLRCFLPQLVRNTFPETATPTSPSPWLISSKNLSLHNSLLYIYLFSLSSHRCWESRRQEILSVVHGCISSPLNGM